MVEKEGLKTLKDLPNRQDQANDFSYREGHQKLFSETELKQEAIKWINYLNTLKGSCSEIYDLTKGLRNGEFKLLEKGQKYEDWEEDSDITGAIKILIDLFNFKEEDFTKEILGKLSSRNICFEDKGDLK